MQNATSANDHTNAQNCDQRNEILNDLRRPTPNPSIIAENVEPQHVPASESNQQGKEILYLTKSMKDLGEWRK